MTTIWKYKLEPGRQVITVPQGSQILSVNNQDLTPCLWVMVDDERQRTEVIIEVFGTGHKIEVGSGIERKFLGTAVCGFFVWHVFARIA